MSVELEPRLTVRDPQFALDGDVMELSLLLPSRQLLELENAAQNQGLTTGQMLRRLINAFLHEPA
jgi:hypothetical protein